MVNNNTTTTAPPKKFLRFRYAAIRRYGEKFWTIQEGLIEFNLNYTVCCSQGKEGDYGENEYPYFIELSNGTKFLCFMHDYGHRYGEHVLSEDGELANALSDYKVIRNQIHNLALL